MKMKRCLCISVFVLIWIASSTSQITLCQNTRRPDCRKIHEIPRVPTPYVICGSGISSLIKHFCGWRVKRKAPEDILLGRQSANQFLSAHHRAKRSFDPVEECCNEGCKLEELKEYCSPF